MKYTQFLIFEICRECNLGAVHTKCPNTDPARFANVDTSRMLDDETIIETAVTMIRVHGFRGCIGWHYYNEPLLKAARILSLMQRIREREPSARFVLWTNGTKIPTDPAALSRLSAFDRAWVTNYDGGDYKRIRTAIPQTTEVRWQLDARRDEQRGGNTAPCGRMFSEFVFDCFGNVHICCIDWRGECTVGNIHADPLPDLVERFQRIRASVAAGIKGNAPQVCKKCQVKHARISDLVPEIAAAARQAVKDESLPYLRRGAETLCVVGMGDVSATWKAHHAARCEKLLRARTDREATQALRACKCYFGACLSGVEWLDGPVADALRLHPRENRLTVPVFRDGEGTDARVPVVRIADLGRVESGRPVLRPRARACGVDLAELRIEDRLARPPSRLGVTFTHYRLPETRLQEHFTWNDALYREAGARVFVVTDREYPVPDYARCVVYPVDMPVFNLSATSNFGIRYALDSGCGRVIKTDADVHFPPEAFAACAGVERGRAVVPEYRMCHDYTRETYDRAPKATGTVAMVGEDWRRAHYDERCVGYGSDDAIVLQAAERAGVRIVRPGHVWHMPHVAGTPQKEFDRKTPRVDHWNRDSGFNPENFGHNRKFYGQAWDSDAWGLGGCDGPTIVVTHYKLPEERLRQFFAWNDALFREFMARVIVVSDVEREGLPAYARVAVYPAALRVFNLAKTSNYGIRLAGQGVICKSDPDCVFSREALEWVSGLAAGKGVCFRYRMAASFDAREYATRWDASQGTLALHFADWDRIGGYDERMEGYGIEDGDAAVRAGKVVDLARPEIPFWHIAHEGGEQVHQAKRRDHWGRADGFNPKNHAANRRVLHNGAWSGERWGLVGV